MFGTNVRANRASHVAGLQPQAASHKRAGRLGSLGVFWAGLSRRLREDRVLRYRFLGFGLLSGALYTLLFSFAREVLALSSRTDSAFFLLPIAIALTFSFVHGAFTDYFWQAMGVQAKRA